MPSRRPPQITKPATLGVRLMNDIRMLQFEPLKERLGFNSDRRFGIYSLETYEGPQKNITKWMSHLDLLTNDLPYRDRKIWIWTWPKPEAEQQSEDDGLTAILQMIYVPEDCQKPDDWSIVEFVDIHSQILGIVGFEFIRLEEFMNSWCLNAEHEMLITTAGISRSILESTASLFDRVQRIATQWSNCKQAEGEPHKTATGRVHRERALRAHELRELIRDSRIEAMFNDTTKKAPELEWEIAGWRHPKLVELLDEFGIRFGAPLTKRPPRNLVELVRELSRALDDRYEPLIVDYELLCNVVHPSLGGQRLYSEKELNDQTYMFNYVLVGKKNPYYLKKGSNERGRQTDWAPKAHFTEAISRSALLCVQVSLILLQELVRIADDIAATAQIAPFVFHKSWRPASLNDGRSCQCECCVSGPWSHEWFTPGPTVRRGFPSSYRRIHP